MLLLQCSLVVSGVGILYGGGGAGLLVQYIGKIPFGGYWFANTLGREKYEVGGAL